MNRNRKKFHENETFKKWLAFTLSLSMVVASGVTSFGSSLMADETDPYSETASTEQTSEQASSDQSSDSGSSAVTDDDTALPDESSEAKSFSADASGDSDVKVEATVSDPDKVKDASLLAEKLETASDDFGSAIDTLKDSDPDTDYSADNTRIFDISFVTAGEKVEPESSTDVKITIDNASDWMKDNLGIKDASEDSIKIMHISDGSAKKVDATVTMSDDKAVISFEADSFGDYAITADEKAAQDKTDEEAAADEEEKDTQKTYTYSDEHLKVTAELSDASAIPDDAKLKVTKIDKDTEGYNYEAYVKAVDENKDSDSVEESDHVFYDVAFIGTEDGREVEYEPEEGTVKVSFEFLDDQLKDELGAEKAGDIEVKHLTIPSDVLSEAGTTRDATDITASDVKVDSVDADITLKGNESAEFKTDDFSVFYFENGKQQANTWNDKKGEGKDFTIDEVIGGINTNDNVSNFAVYANHLTNFNKHMEGNIKVGSLEITGNGPLNQDDSVISRTAVTSIHVEKTVNEVDNNKDRTFNFAVYKAGETADKDNELATFSITVKKGEKSGEYTLTDHSFALSPQDKAENEVISFLKKDNVVVYELDADGTPVMANQKNGEYTVTYNGNEVSSSADTTRYTNYIGTIESPTGNVKLEPKFFNNGKIGVTTYIQYMGEKKYYDSNWNEVSGNERNRVNKIRFSSGSTSDMYPENWTHDLSQV